MNKSFKQKKILIAPLDWGLGHATRCISLINVFLTLNCEVTIAAPPVSKALLQTEFPELEFLNINSYSIKYSKKKRWMPFKILLQIPKIIRAVKFEHSWLQLLLEKRHFDAVISDNRYGFYADKTVSVFITHQLQIKASTAFTESIARKITYKFINRFNECWIPDFKNETTIAGVLSHPTTLPETELRYLGPLSRFEKKNNQLTTTKFLIIISGPEPQRSIFEEKIFSFINTCAENFIVVKGKPYEEKLLEAGKNYKVYNHLPTKDLETAFNESEFVISRCGYTSVMEILALQKKSILIPTPGQTEQEYLAQHLMKQNWCYTFLQEEDFSSHIQKAINFNYQLPPINKNAYKKILEEFITTL